MKLSERLEALLALAECTDDAERDHRAPDAECVFVDTRPAEFETLLREAAELARRVEDAHRTYVNAVYDTDAEEDRGEVLDTLPKSLIGFVRIVPEAGLGVGGYHG